RPSPRPSARPWPTACRSPKSSRPWSRPWPRRRPRPSPPPSSRPPSRKPRMQAAIEMHRVSKSYPLRRAVDNLSLTVPPGAVFALLGDNGAGKSTTIRILNGLTPPDSGWARVLGHDAWEDASRLRQRIGYVPERPKFYDWMTVSEIGWFTSGFQKRGYLGRYLDLTDGFALDPRARLGTLSKGQYAKVGLALAMAVDPEVLILDEPTSGLDLLVRREFLASMVNLAGQGRTILISSHQPPATAPPAT